MAIGQGLYDALKSMFNGSASNSRKVAVKKKDIAVDYSNSDFRIMRNVYRNKEKSLALGNFSKTIIDTTAGFLGTPEFRYEGDENAALDYLSSHRSAFAQLHTTLLVEGRAYLRVHFETADLYYSDPRFVFTVLGQDRVEKINGRLGELIGFKVSTTVQYDASNPSNSYLQTESIYKDKTVITRTDGDIRGLAANETLDNKFGVVPIIEFVNDPDADGVGQSELRSTLQYMGMYSDVMAQARKISEQHANPTVKIRVGDWKRFKEANPTLFTDDGDIVLEDIDVVGLGQEDNYEYVKVEGSTDSLTKLLEYIFLCIVQNSRIPEFLMGAAISSSKASASEQATVMDIKINGKRQMLDGSYKTLAVVFQQMWAKVTAGFSSGAVEELNWKAIDLQNPEVANIAKTMTEAFKGAVEAGLLEEDEAKELIRKYFK